MKKIRKKCIIKSVLFVKHFFYAKFDPLVDGLDGEIVLWDETHLVSRLLLVLVKYKHSLETNNLNILDVLRSIQNTIAVTDVVLVRHPEPARHGQQVPLLPARLLALTLYQQPSRRPLRLRNL